MPAIADYLTSSHSPGQVMFQGATWRGRQEVTRLAQDLSLPVTDAVVIVPDDERAYVMWADLDCLGFLECPLG